LRYERVAHTFPHNRSLFVNHESTTQSVLFPALLSKPVVAKLDEEHSSSDGGALLLKAIDDRLGLSESLAGCLRDSRQAGKVTHETIELMRQRIFAIALGYPDGNDARELSDDPLHKLAVGRDPVQGGSLASQPTLSRFENSAGRVDLFRLADAPTTSCSSLILGTIPPLCVKLSCVAPAEGVGHRSRGRDPLDPLRSTTFAANLRDRHGIMRLATLHE